MNEMILEEIKEVVNAFPFMEQFKNKTILITGGTGLIGSYLIRTIKYLNEEKSLNVKIIGVARNKEKVLKLKLEDHVSWIYQDMKSAFDIEENIDYILHTASPTDSSFFIHSPVEVINDTLAGLNAILTLAQKCKTQGVVFLSSLEVYGSCIEDKFLKENEYYSIDCTNVRNSYSEGKKMLECLCASYAVEYAVPVKIVRLGQCFGPGVGYTDNRVFAQFARAVTEQKDIILATKGETKRSYCSIKDAILGIFLVLFNGKPGEAYNLASDNSYYSIYELAQIFIKDTSSNILIEEKQDNKYLGTIKFGLDTTKIKAIGFNSLEGLNEMVIKLKNYFKTIK
ncbi:MAG: NAD-dependent epimerase/dehydratase family protein [Anaeroplasmataceae bacterium]|nr:NAD-dependent epimerase/dehydratase family protein [Anaeroplasmataceae bacterium]